MAVAPITGSATYTTGNPVLEFFYVLFNGISEVPLFSSPVTGILIVSGVFLASRKAGAMMVLSGLIGAANRHDIRCFLYECCLWSVRL